MTNRWIPIKLSTTICSFLVSSVILTGCGGGSVASAIVAGIGGTGIGVGGTGIVFGAITGFGSIFVNGTEFETDTSEIIIDGQVSANQDPLRVGMVVRLEVKIENGVYVGDALKVVYDDEVEGPLTNLNPDPLDPTKKIGTVFGQTVTFDDTTTLFEDTPIPSNPAFGFDTMVTGNVIEISGFRVSPTQINATYVKKKFDSVSFGSTEVELRGDIKQYSGGSTFEIDGVLINFDPSGVTTEIDVPGPLQNDIYVEVEGVMQTATSVTASKIEAEDEDFGEDVGDISLQGVISDYVSDASFKIDGQLIDASSAQFSPAALTLVNDLNIEVEGAIVGGTLFADKVELREARTKLRSEISMVDTINHEFFKVIYPVAIPNEVTVRIDSQTLFEDETGAIPATPPFSLDDLSSMDFVRVEGQEVNGEVVASIVKRTDPDNQLRLEGEVDGYMADNWIEVLGIKYLLDAGTSYEPSPPPVFVQGDIVEIDDDNDPLPADGIADSVELDD